MADYIHEILQKIFIGWLDELYLLFMDKEKVLVSY